MVLERNNPTLLVANQNWETIFNQISNGEGFKTKLNFFLQFSSL